MTTQMFIDGQLVPASEVKLHFQYYLDDGPPHAWLDINSNSDDSSLAGVAINCLDVGDIATLDKLCGITLAFNQDDEIERAELSESVFWRPGDQTLELENLQLKFGALTDGTLPIEIAALCFDHEKQGIKVLLRAQANVAKK